MTSAEIDELKGRPGNSCAEVAERLGVRVRPHGHEVIGPCILCSSDLTDRTATRWQTKDGGWVCAGCSTGGDVISLVQKALNIDFKAAVEWLGGVNGKVDHKAQEGRRKAREADQAKKQDASEKYRERERSALCDIWRRALDPPGTVVEAYLNNRGIPLPSWPQGAARLRLVREMAYVHGTVTDEVGRKSANVIHRGPAMVAAITREGRFLGLHVTYLDPGGSKLRICDPATGEALPARKVRGSKSGGAIELIKVTPPAEPVRIILGEGIETVLSVWHAMKSCEIDLTTTEFWSAIDLGNLGGKAVAQIVHPELKTASGRSRRVPGSDPDLSEPGIAINEGVGQVVILGDGDSDRLTTQCAVSRAAERFRAAKPGIRVCAYWADEGKDFNDMLIGQTSV